MDMQPAGKFNRGIQSGDHRLRKPQSLEREVPVCSAQLALKLWIALWTKGWWPGAATATTTPALKACGRQ